MNAAILGKSARLQKVYNLLADGREYSTREIIAHADVCAVNSIICELRSNGCEITCRRDCDAWYYKMEQAK